MEPNFTLKWVKIPGYYFYYYIPKHKSILKLQKKIHLNSQNTAQRALCFSQAVCASLISQKQLADTKINQAEKYLGLLWVKKAVIELKVVEADEQIGVICEILNEWEISKTCGSNDDKEDPTSDCYPLPPSSLPNNHSSQCSDDILSEEPMAFTEDNVMLECQQIMDKLMGKSSEDGDYMLDE